MTRYREPISRVWTPIAMNLLRPFHVPSQYIYPTRGLGNVHPRRGKYDDCHECNARFLKSIGVNTRWSVIQLDTRAPRYAAPSKPQHHPFGCCPRNVTYRRPARQGRNTVVDTDGLRYPRRLSARWHARWMGAVVLTTENVGGFAGKSQYLVLNRNLEGTSSGAARPCT